MRADPPSSRAASGRRGSPCTSAPSGPLVDSGSGASYTRIAARHRSARGVRAARAGTSARPPSLSVHDEPPAEVLLSRLEVVHRDPAVGQVLVQAGELVEERLLVLPGSRSGCVGVGALCAAREAVLLLGAGLLALRLVPLELPYGGPRSCHRHPFCRRRDPRRLRPRAPFGSEAAVRSPSRCAPHLPCARARCRIPPAGPPR